jgi:hypothetical protein
MNFHDPLKMKLDEFQVQIIEIKSILFAVSEIDDMPEQGLRVVSGAERLVKLLETDFDSIHHDVVDRLDAEEVEA